MLINTILNSLNIAHFIGNILLIHLPDVLVPVIATGNSSTPFRVFMRILSTVIHILSWYDEDPFDATTKTHQSMITVRRNCHMAVSRLMNNKYPRPNRYWLSQFDMAMTQWSLIGIVGIRPNQCAFFGTTEKEFEEYFYFWRVIGYCVGIEDRFNICFGVEGYEETREFLDICFQRCYKVHLDKQSAPVVMGMNLTEGVFLALEGAAPRFLICYESFMKYWYDTLGVRHPIKLDTFERKLNYAIFIFVMEYVLRIRLFYIIFSWLFFSFGLPKMPSMILTMMCCAVLSVCASVFSYSMIIDDAFFFFVLFRFYSSCFSLLLVIYLVVGSFLVILSVLMYLCMCVAMLPLFFLLVPPGYLNIIGSLFNIIIIIIIKIYGAWICYYCC